MMLSGTGGFKILEFARSYLYLLLLAFSLPVNTKCMYLFHMKYLPHSRAILAHMRLLTLWEHEAHVRGRGHGG